MCAVLRTFLYQLCFHTVNMSHGQLLSMVIVLLRDLFISLPAGISLGAMVFVLTNPYGKTEKRPAAAEGNETPLKKANKAPAASSLVMMESVPKPNRPQKRPGDMRSADDQINVV